MPPRHASRGDRAAPPGRDAVDMVAGQWGTRAGGFHCSMSGNSKHKFWFGNTWKPSYQNKVKLDVLHQHATKTSLESFKEHFFHQDSCQDQQDLLISAGHHCLFTLHSTSHIYISSKQNRPKQQHQPTEIPLASAKEPLASRSSARFQTELRVSGCTGPS